jgi:hypothetical protein
MTLQIWFWLIMFLWLIGGLWGEYKVGEPYPIHRGIWYFGAFILFALLGWGVFGAPIK